MDRWERPIMAGHGGEWKNKHRLTPPPQAFAQRINFRKESAWRPRVCKLHHSPLVYPRMRPQFKETVPRQVCRLLALPLWLNPETKTCKKMKNIRKQYKKNKKRFFKKIEKKLYKLEPCDLPHTKSIELGGDLLWLSPSQLLPLPKCAHRTSSVFAFTFCCL